MDLCEICGIGRFCDACGKDGKCHRIVCAPTHGERVLKYSDYLTRTITDGFLTISQPCFDGKHVVRIFDVSYACGVCGNNANDWYKLLNGKVRYYLCKPCSFYDRQLCGTCGNDTQICKDALKKLSKSMFIIREHFYQELLPEIWRIIAITYYQMLPCGFGEHVS